MRVRAIGIFSIHTRAGNSAGFGSWTMSTTRNRACSEPESAMSAHTASLRRASARKASAAPETSLAHEIIAGLTARPKRISPKYFNDEAGAQLFEAIMATPEYYPTRCEIAILRDRAAEIARHIPDGAALVEFGSGSR